MNNIKILERLEVAIRKRNPILADDYLMAGLPEKTVAKRFRMLTGNTQPLHDLYTWHDGTKFVHLKTGETYSEGIAKVSFLPVDTFLFTDSQQAIGMMHTWKEVSRRRPALTEGVWRYFPLLCGGSGRFMLDLTPNQHSRIIYYNDEPADTLSVAYPTFDSFLADILLANETGGRLAYFSRSERDSP